MQAILIILGIYLLYKFIVDFVIPVYKTSKRVQAQFRDIHQRAKDNGEAHQNTYKASSTNNPGYNQTKTNSKDYIDFEEID